MTPTLTASRVTARESRRVAWETYRDHVLACPIAERGRWCRECLELDRAASAEDGERWGWPS